MQTVDLAIMIILILGGLVGLGGITRLLSPLALFLAITAAVSVYLQVAELFS